MTNHLSKSSARTEINDALARHLEILDNVTKCCITSNGEKEQFYYLLAIPIIYSAWEGYFRVVCSICLRRICIRGVKAKKYKHQYSALWLQRESFTESFIKTLFNSMTLGTDIRKTNPGRFKALSKFSSDINNWLESPINHAVNFDRLIMTYSNVNQDVVKLNCEIIGIDIVTVDFSKLDELLSRRNDISHGGLINYPKEDEVKELVLYTDSLLKSFNACIVAWIKAT